MSINRGSKNFPFLVQIVIFFSVCMSTSYSADAGEIDNVSACVQKAKDFANLTLSEFEATYEGNILSPSIVRWKTSSCKVKLGNVVQLRINDELIIVDGFAGAKSKKLNAILEERTNVAIKQLKHDIALLEQRMNEATKRLSSPIPNHKEIRKYVDQGITEILGNRDADELLQSQKAAKAEQERREEQKRLEEKRRLEEQKGLKEQKGDIEMAAAKASSTPAAVSDAKIHTAMSKSDDYSKHRDEFNAAGVELVRNGACSVPDLNEYGGFWRSTKRKNGYFIDCKGKRVNYTLGDISSATLVEPVLESVATDLCREAINGETRHTAPKFHLLDHATKVFGNGNVGVTQGFSAKNGLGIKMDYRAYCIVTPSRQVEIQSLEQK